MRTILIALVIATAATVASPQVIQPGALTAEVEVHVVNVDVSVTDAHGVPVRDLTRDDFEIFEDGVLQTVTNFSVIRNTATAASATEPKAHTSSDRRRIMLIVDNNYIGVIERNQAIDVLDKYIHDSFAADWAVTAIGHRAEVIQSFTTDKALIHAALLKIRNMPSSEAQHKIDRSVLSERFNRKGDAVLPENYREKVMFSSREQTFRNLMTIQNTARSVVETARGYAGEDGKKFIVLLTGGMELNTTFSAFEGQDDGELRELKTQMTVVIDDMVHEANAANFTVHIVNAHPRGMVASQHDISNRSSGIIGASLLHDTGNEPIDVSDVDSLPLSIAAGTGGMYLPSSDVRESLQRIDTLTSNFYSLGYSPEHNGDREYHRISVRVKRTGVHVANRAGYFDATPEDRLESILRSRMKFDQGFGSIPVKVEVGQASQGERLLLLPVTTVMPLARITVVPEDHNFVGRVHVYCSVFDQDGNNIGFSHQAPKITMTRDEVSSAGDFRYTLKVQLKPGTFTIVITLRDELSNEMGSVSEAVHL